MALLQIHDRIALLEVLPSTCSQRTMTAERRTMFMIISVKIDQFCIVGIVFIGGSEGYQPGNGEGQDGEERDLHEVVRYGIYDHNSKFILLGINS